MATATAKKEERFVEAIGRRKTSIARARLTPATKMSVMINGRTVEEYFPTKALQMVALEAFLKAPSQFTSTVVVKGGGIAGQAVAVRHAISRALLVHDHSLRGALKAEGFLKRDPRAKERRKAGLVKARKRKQWSKR